MEEKGGYRGWGEDNLNEQIKARRKREAHRRKRGVKEAISKKKREQQQGQSVGELIPRYRCCFD